VTPEPIDLHFLGAERSIGVYLLDTPEGPALFDTGPTSTLPRLKDGLREAPGYIAFARENGTVYHTYTVTAPDPFVAPFFGFLLDRTPKEQPPEVVAYRKDEYPD